MSVINDLCQKLNNDLKQIDNDCSDILKKSERSIYCVESCLKQLKEHICRNTFSNQDEEIEFFKKIKPSVYCKLIFFVKIFNIESKRPNGSDKSQKKHLINELNKIELFFSENLEFYQYYRNNMTYLDDKYFVRGKLNIRLYIDTFIYDADPEFSTSHDYKVAKILANDLLGVYLKSELAILDRREFKRNDSYRKSKYAWTESKTALVELIYAIHASNCINNGSLDIKEIAQFVEYTFDIDLGDFYRTFLQIKNRQSSPKFIDTMRAALIKKIEEQDE